MKIANVEAIPVSIPIKVPMHWATGNLKAIDIVLVKITAEDGTTGYAEAVPRPGIYGSTQQSIYYAVKDYLAPAFIGEDSFAVERIMEKYRLLLFSNLAAKAALDVALYDLNGKLLKTPACHLMGGCYRTKVKLSWTNFGTYYGMDSMVEDAKEKYKEGYRAIKVKAGVSIEEDIKLCTLIREACPDMEINIDPNMVYNREEAYRLGKALEGIIQSFEEPIQYWDDEGRKELAGKVNIPILSDESTFTVDMVQHQMKLGAIKRLGLKVPRTGFTLSAKAIHLAEANNIPCQISTQAECDLGAAACLQLAAAYRQISLPCELALYRNSICDTADTMKILKTPIKIEDGYMHVPDGPGLGVELDWDKIEAYAVRF